MAQYQQYYDGFANIGHERYVPTARMTVSNSAFLPSSEVDIHTGRLLEDRPPRRRTQSMRIDEAERRMEEERRKAAAAAKGLKPITCLLIVGVMIFVLGMTLLIQRSIIESTRADIDEINSVIADWNTQNQLLRDDIAEATDDAHIRYTAAQQLNMIPSEAASAIELVAPDTRPMLTAQQDHVAITSQTQETVQVSAGN